MCVMSKRNANVQPTTLTTLLFSLPSHRIIHDWMQRKAHSAVVIAVRQRLSNALCVKLSERHLNRHSQCAAFRFVAGGIFFPIAIISMHRSINMYNNNKFTFGIKEAPDVRCCQTAWLVLIVFHDMKHIQLFNNIHLSSVTFVRWFRYDNIAVTVWYCFVLSFPLYTFDSFLPFIYYSNMCSSFWTMFAKRFAVGLSGAHSSHFIFHRAPCERCDCNTTQPLAYKSTPVHLYTERFHI